MIMNKDEFLNKHWFMYHKLEGEFLKIEKTIPVVSENFETFSYSYMRLLGSICSEFINILKILQNLTDRITNQSISLNNLY